MGHLDTADGLHALLALFLLFQQFFLPGDVAAVAFGDDILSVGLDRLSGYDLLSYGRLDRDLELVHRDYLLELFTDEPASGIGF